MYRSYLLDLGSSFVVPKRWSTALLVYAGSSASLENLSSEEMHCTEYSVAFICLRTGEESLVNTAAQRPHSAAQVLIVTNGTSTILTCLRLVDGCMSR